MRIAIPTSVKHALLGDKFIFVSPLLNLHRSRLVRLPLSYENKCGSILIRRTATNVYAYRRLINDLSLGRGPTCRGTGIRGESCRRTLNRLVWVDPTFDRTLSAIRLQPAGLPVTTVFAVPVPDPGANARVAAQELLGFEYVPTVKVGAMDAVEGLAVVVRYRPVSPVERFSVAGLTVRVSAVYTTSTPKSFIENN